MDKKLIFLDIDGTLTVAGSNVPPDSALTAIRAARQKGHGVILCTGRNYDMLRPLLTYGFDGVIASAGGYIEIDGKAVYDCPMTEAQRLQVLHTLQREGVYRTIECFDGSYTDDGFKEFIQERSSDGANSELLRWRRQLESELNIRSMKEYAGQPVYKVVFMSPSQAAVERVKTQLESDFLCIVQEPDRYGIVNGEIVNRKFDKGKAVKRVCSYTQTPIADTFGFGDSMNDRELLQTVGYGVCMENGSEALKHLADWICPAVQEDGIFHAFTALKLI